MDDYQQQLVWKSYEWIPSMNDSNASKPLMIYSRVYVEN